MLWFREECSLIQLKSEYELGKLEFKKDFGIFFIINFSGLKHAVIFQSYASILYLRLPPGFRIILRGKDVEHHNIVNDMMLSQEITYRPQPGADGIPKDVNVMLHFIFHASLWLVNWVLIHLLFSSDDCCSDYWVCEGCEIPY